MVLATEKKNIVGILNVAMEVIHKLEGNIKTIQKGKKHPSPITVRGNDDPETEEEARALREGWASIWKRLRRS